MFALATTARVDEGQASAAGPVPVEHARSVERTVLIFIDSLSREVATNPEIMPTLGRLAQSGVSLEVKPCRDQLTYLCLRAAFTGHDDSSLLALSNNFRPNHDGPPDSLLSAINARGKRIAVIGSADLHPYRRWLASEQHLAKQEELPENIVAQLRSALQRDPQLSIVALASGDMAAHVYGTHSKEYVAAFRRMDATVAAIAALVGPESNLVVFGDHGHDAAGRHLPGTEANTWAVYAGPAFRAGVRSEMAITDHRVVLGTLLGVPTEPTYRGPALSSIFDAGWVTRTLSHGLPRLAASRVADHASTASRWLSAILVVGFALLGAWLLARTQFRALSLSLLAVAACITAVIGLGYDWIRNVVHDHGDSPERAICLLLPVALGVALAAIVRNTSLRDNILTTRFHGSAVGTLLVSFLLMMPTAYYYGSRRAVVLAGVLGLSLLLVLCLFQRQPTWRWRVRTSLVLLFAGSVLFNFYSVRQLGPETGGASTWALDAPLYTQSTWLALIAAKLVLYAVLMAPRAAEYPSDCAAAAGVLSTSVLVEFAGAQLPRQVYLFVFAALVLGAVFARRQCAASLFAGALLLLDHLYSRHCSQLAPIELLLAGTAVLLRWLKASGPKQLTWLAGLSITIAIYLMLWPMVGFHLAGLDFSFMFEWIAEANYERDWQWIAFGVVVKLGLPIALVLAVGRKHLRDTMTRRIVIGALSAKVALLAILIAFYAVSHSMASQQAIAMLSELVLVLFGTCTTLLIVPASHTSRRSVRRNRDTWRLEQPRRVLPAEPWSTQSSSARADIVVSA